MTLYIKALLLLTCGAVYLSFAVSPTREQQARFFAGVFLIESRKDLSDSAKAERFKTLETASGLNAAEARTLLTSLRKQPEEWKLLSDRMRQIISEAQTEPKKVITNRDSLKTSEKKGDNQCPKD